jgi:hypothetical protein
MNFAETENLRHRIELLYIYIITTIQTSDASKNTLKIITDDAENLDHLSDQRLESDYKTHNDTIPSVMKEFCWS